MRAFIIGSILLIIHLYTFSQNCSPDILMQKPGSWKAGMSSSGQKSFLQQISPGKKSNRCHSSTINEKLYAKGIRSTVC